MYNNLDIPSITLKKTRDQKSGDITDQTYTKVEAKSVIVMDDLCDGGRTFFELGKKLRADGVENLTLFVIHGVFSNNAIPRLREVYHTIISTNTYADFWGLPVIVRNVWPIGP